MQQKCNIVLACQLQFKVYNNKTNTRLVRENKNKTNTHRYTLTKPKTKTIYDSSTKLNKTNNQNVAKT